MRTAAFLATAILTTTLAGCLTPTADDVGAAGDAPAATHGYPALKASPIRGLTPSEIADLREGKGAGYALAAELNAFPGPRHVLDLADELALTPRQRELTQALYETMKADAVRAGDDLLARHEEVDRGFRERTFDEDGLRDALERLADADAELRFVHLRTHLTMAGMLTHEQIARYEELRGYAAAGHASDGAAHEAHHE